MLAVEGGQADVDYGDVLMTSIDCSDLYWVVVPYRRYVLLKTASEVASLSETEWPRNLSLMRT